MSRRQETISEFLQRSKQYFQSSLLGRAIHGPLTFVVGNQSADLDSMSSAILYAYFATNFLASSSSTGPVIPVLSIPSEDISIRPEFAVAFKHAGIDASDLVTLTDFPILNSSLQSNLPADNTQWVLVDHNKLEGDLADTYSPYVCGVLDHHVDEAAISSQAAPRRIETCGSCTSLVVDHFRKDWESFTASSVADAEINARLAQLALGSILVDTGRLKNEAKTMDVDKDAVDLCTKVIRDTPGQENFKKKPFFNELMDAKRDVSQLTPDGVLRKDYKAWTEAEMKLGMSTVPITLAALREKAKKSYHPARVHGESSWDQIEREFVEARGLEIHAILATAVTEEEPKGGKGLLMQWSSQRAKATVEKFESVARDELKLERATVDGMAQEPAGRIIWSMGDRSKTRKQVGPLLRQVMRSM